MSPRPPLLLRLLARLLIRGEHAAYIRDDLEQLYRRARMQSRAHAIAHYLRHTLGSAPSTWSARVQARNPTGFSVLDLKLGVRMLVRHPGLTAVSVLTMAFAVGLGAVGFEGVRQLARPRLPIEDADRVVSIQHRHTARDFVSLSQQLTTVEELGAYRDVERNLIVEGRGSAPVGMAEISATAFRIMGEPPLMGRTLTAADEIPGAPLALVIGYELWRRRFDFDLEVVGRVVRVGRESATIVGVMPEGFRFPVSHDAWLPLRLDPLALAAGDGPRLQLFGRLAAERSLAGAQAELTAVAARTSTEPGRMLRPRVVRFPEAYLGLHGLEISAIIRILLYSLNAAFVLFVVLVCANIAALIFARTATRESELVVRTALGASRARLLFQLFAESLVLNALAAVIGLAAAAWFLRWMLAAGQMQVLDSTLPYWVDPGLSFWSVLYAASLALLGAVIAGVLPARRLTHALGAQLRQIGAGGGQPFRGVWTLVIVGQLAITVGFVAFSVYAVVRGGQIRNVETGYAAERYLAARLRTESAASAAELERRLLAEPGVRGITWADNLPATYHERIDVQVDALANDTAPDIRMQVAAVAPNFFDVLDVPVLHGRNFTPGDEGRPVAIVNEAFVTDLLRGRNPLGVRVRFLEERGDPDRWSEWHEVVGVARQIALTNDPELPSKAGIYTPGTRAHASRHMILYARGDAGAFTARLREVAAAVDPDIRVHDTIRLDRAALAEVPLYRFWMRVLIAASGLGLLLSLSAIYSIMAYTVSRRTREIGVRIALGAQPRSIVLGALARPFAQGALGVLVGVGMLVLAGGGIRSWRFAAFVLAFTAILLAVVSLAAIVPVRRALRIQPTEALRAEA